jgi:hypothetical protein
MFAVIYQGYVKTGREIEYKKAWHRIACYYIDCRGALGSCLHEGEKGLWLAYSRWPDKQTRDAAWPGENRIPSPALPEDIKEAITTLKDCLDKERKLPEIYLNVVDDMLILKEWA